MTMHDTTTEPTWITAARAAVAEQAAVEAERQATQRVHEEASRRKMLLELLEECAIPSERAELVEVAGWGLVAMIDGYRFVRDRDGWALCRLLECPVCTQTTRSAAVVNRWGHDLGHLLAATEPGYHRCPGRPVTDADYDEDGELRDRTPRATPPPPPPTAGEKLLAALAEYIAEQGGDE